MGKKVLNVALIGLPYSAHPISWYRPKFTGIDKHQTSSHQTHNLRGRKKNTFQQTIPLLLASVGWGLRLCLHGATTRIKHFCCLCIACVQVGLGCAKDVSAQTSLIWRKSWFGSPVKWKKKKFSNDNIFLLLLMFKLISKHLVSKKKDSSGIISKNVEWNPALDGTTTARPQVPIAYFFPPFIFLQLNLNNADQVQSQRALEMDKGNSWWSTPLSSRAWQKKW